MAWFAFWAPGIRPGPGVDFVAEATRHYAAIGLEVPRLTARLQCYLVHVGLDSQAYNACKGEVRGSDLAATARRTLALATAPIAGS